MKPSAQKYVVERDQPPSDTDDEFGSPQKSLPQSRKQSTLPPLGTRSNSSAAVGGKAFITDTDASRRKNNKTWNPAQLVQPSLKTRIDTPSTSRSNLGATIRKRVIHPKGGRGTTVDDKTISPMTNDENRRKLAAFLPLMEETPGFEHQMSSTYEAERVLETHCYGLPQLREAAERLAKKMEEIDLRDQSRQWEKNHYIHRREAKKQEEPPSDSDDDSPESRLKRIVKRFNALGKDEVVPRFRSHRQGVFEPRQGYIAKKVHGLRTNPDTWKDFTSEVSHWKKSKLSDSDDIIRRNVTSVMSNHPSEGSVRREQRLRDHNEHIREVQEKHTQRLADFIENIKDVHEKRAERHAEIARRFSIIIAFASRTRAFMRVLHRLESKRRHAAREEAALKIQRTYSRHRRGIAPLSHARALTLKTRLIVRFMTRVKARRLRDIEVDKMKNLLLHIDFYNRILVAFRRFHPRVVRCQRLWRERQLGVRLERELREVQWRRAVTVRKDDLEILVEKLTQEAKLTKRDTPQLIGAVSELHVISLITDEQRDAIIADFRVESRQTFAYKSKIYAEALAEWHQTPFKQRPKLPQAPFRRILFPAEQLDVLIKTTCRELINDGKADAVIRERKRQHKQSRRSQKEEDEQREKNAENKVVEDALKGPIGSRRKGK